MVARSSAATMPETPDDDDLALPLRWARWTAQEVTTRGFDLAAAARGLDGSWRPCDVAEILSEADGVVASIGQRPSCGGVVTTVHVWGAEGLRGAFWLERAPGGREPVLFRVLLLQALLRAAPSDFPN